MYFDKEKLLATFQGLPEIIETYYNNIPEEALDRKRSENAWTIREHLYHIAEVQEMLYSRILKIRDEENPVITPYYPENESELVSKFQSMQHAFEHYKAVREKQISLVGQLMEADYEKEAKHDQYIKYNITIVLNHMIFHEYWHMYRIEELWLTKDEFFTE